MTRGSTFVGVILEKNESDSSYHEGRTGSSVSSHLLTTGKKTAVDKKWKKVNNLSTKSTEDHEIPFG